MDILIYESHSISDTQLPFIMNNQKVTDSTFRISNWHSNIEILCCTDGSGSVLINSETIPFEKDDIVIINSNYIHTVVSDSCVLYQYLIIDQTFCSQNGIFTDKTVFCNRIISKEALRFFNNIKESYESSTYRTAKIRNSVLSFLVFLCDNYVAFEVDENVRNPEIIAESIRKTMAYIHSNFSESITLDILSQKVGVSKYHLEREFKKITHITIINYINMIRCEYAKRLLKTTDSKISTIYTSCGFDNFSYFSKTFRKHTGMLPSEYRKTV